MGTVPSDVSDDDSDPQPGDTQESHESISSDFIAVLVDRKLREYRILSPLRKARSGLTFRAWQMDFDREVIIKVHFPRGLAVPEGFGVRPLPGKELEYGDSKRSFLREAKTLARFDHPNIVRVFDFFEIEESAYLVMKYEKGDSLYHYFRYNEGNLSEKEFLYIFYPLLHGLRLVHNAGIVHRDIKPSNIMIRQVGWGGGLTLLGFGTARQILPSSKLTRLEDDGYKAWEQLANDRDDHGPWTDIFGLGCVLYRFISGKNPVPVTTRVSEIVNGGPDPLVPATDVGQGKFSDKLLRAIDQMLRVNLTDRPKSVDALLALLPTPTPRATPTPAPTATPMPTPSATLMPTPKAAPTPASKVTPMSTPGVTPRLRPPGSEPKISGGLEVGRHGSYTDHNTGMKFIWIPGGEFLMGSPESEMGRDRDEGPQHRVMLDGFWMGKYPVTQAEWVALGMENESSFQGERNPVEKISWDQAQEFVQKLDEKMTGVFALPSEAQWEYACRAGTTTPFSFGETISTDQANYDGNGVYGPGVKGNYRRKTTPVGTFPPNPWGLCDMHGNVMEWCRDWYDAAFYKQHEASEKNPLCQCVTKDRVLRGGSWYESPNGSRSAQRNWSEPGKRSREIGFRLVRLR
ncbi:MAG: SUMF1/EgtB/PvdO family nonheme iron enzyme [Magnetococcales bacterium]|nr:SUMF1/EgtB/PvdO family nonheme iron enzyme [Magnetococcales bacterium]